VLSVFSNWFYKLANAFDDFPKVSDIANYPAGQIVVNDLRFGFDSSFLPIASFTASKLSGVAPLTVSFNASASSDRDGNTIRNYRWSMGEGDSTYGNVKTGVTTSYVFTQPGKYTVKLMVQNTKGVPAFATKDILVMPATTGKWLSLWVLDSYIGNLANFYKKQVLVNDQVVWEDDVAGDEKWQHLVLNVTPQVGTGTTAKIAVRLSSINATTTPMDDMVNLPELRVWVDDVYLFGGTVTNTGFEGNSSVGWTLTSQGAWGSQVSTESARSGTYSMVLRQGIFQTRNANEWIELWQNVPITP
jgi:PKD repeat protein